MFEKFALAARMAVEVARREAEHRGDTRIGAEHLLIALLADDDMAEASGIDADAARDAADRLDRAALAAVGLDVGAFRPTHPGPAGRRVRHFTAGARAVIAGSVTRATSEKSRTITTRHLMLAVLDRLEPDPAASLLAALSIDAPTLRGRLDAAA